MSWLIVLRHTLRILKLSAEPFLFLRALYLQSAAYRALAAKKDEEKAQQALYLKAVEIAEKAASTYAKKGVGNVDLLGKIHFNLGAAHADNPKGDLKRAMDSYSIASECFEREKEVDDIIRTKIRQGKVYLLQGNYDLSQKSIDECRPQITSERLAMQADYLEAQLKFAIKDIEKAIKVARNGLVRAKALGAKEDELRLTTLLQAIENR